MAGDVQHVVDASEEPVEPVLVAARAVTGEIDAVVPSAEVRLDESFGVAADAAQHRRPRLREREKSAAGFDALALAVANLAFHSFEGGKLWSS
jgi:hypothetical protein